MRSSSNGMKNLMLKKYSNSIIVRKTSSNGTPVINTEQVSQMNKTSLSSISSSSLKNEDKLSQLKQKLQKERQNMRKTGRRFKQSSSTSTQIQIQTEQPEQVKPITSKMLYKTTKVSTGVGSAGSAASSLYDFGSIKAQVENKTKAAFKKNNNAKNDLIVPVYTTQQILNSVNGPVLGQKSLSKQQKVSQQSGTQKVSSPIDRKRQTVNLMQLSAVIQKSPAKNTSKQKPRESNQDQTQIKFFDLSKVKKSSNSQNQQILTNSRVFQTAIKQQKKRNKEVQSFLSKIGLEQFTQNFISLGFDEVQTLIEVQVDDLNQMMMRAKQQDKLMKYIKEFKIKNQIEETQPERPLIDRPSSIKSRLGYRPKSAAFTTEPSQSSQTVENSRMRSTTQNLNMSDSTLVNKSSIFYFMGGDQWSLESQIRKACSGCFKVSYDAVKRGDCYYCEECDPGELDELEFSLDESMVREYH